MNISSLTVYTVGGAVRDQLLNIKAKDLDFVVVGATPEQMLSLGFEQVGRDFPVFLHPKTKQEYALARTERKQGSGYTGFVCYAAPDVTLEQDLLRRDLTINAMAQDSKGNIIDPYGGQQDIANKILRHVSPAFAEDPLRVLRVARFAARFAHLGFTIADETLALMQQLADSGELEQLTAERVWQEMQRALTEQSPWVFFETLRACNALKVLWPSLDVLWGIPNPAQWHPEICSGIHTMMVLQQACLLATDAKVRFAAVCHDLGKGVTPVEQYPHHRGHEAAGLPLVTAICQQYKVPNQYQSLALKVCQYHLHVHKAFELKPSTILKMFNKLDLWRKADEFELFLLCCTADAKGRLGKEHEPYPQATWLQQCAQACLQITAKPFVEQGLQGKAIKQSMELARLNVIKQFKEQHD